MGMLAGAVFFFLERNTVAASWRTSVTVAGLIQFVAFVHYIYMRDIWVSTGETPTVYRYIDWLITVPMQIVEFYLILAAVRKVPTSMFWRLLIASLVMLVGGYLGEAGYIQEFVGFIIGMAGWIYILFEIFSGEAGRAAATVVTEQCCHLFRCYENDSYNWLGNLPTRLRIWLPSWWN